jgi:hypothetical protein
MAEKLEDRISSLLAEDSPEGGTADALLAEGYAQALKLDAERLSLERSITRMAAHAHEPEAAQDLRHAWLRHRTLNAELAGLRQLLRRLHDAASA